MMTGHFLIDNVDIFTTYGVYVVKGGFNGLFGLPSMKKPLQNDWHEYDGLELMPTFFSHLDTRTFSIDFACRNGLTAHDTFVTMLYASLHTYSLPGLGYGKQLRVVGEKKMSFEGDLVMFSIDFADDAPLSGYIYQAPSSSLPVDNTYLLDSIPLSQYGIRVLDGSQQEIRQWPEAKANLVRNVSIQSGAIAAAVPLKRQANKVKLNLLITAGSVSEFWKNWNALAHNLAEQGTRTFTASGTAYDCYYEQCAIRRAMIEPTNVWIEFTLTLTFTYQ